MADVVAITQPGELPASWRHKWQLLCHAYENRFRGRRTRRWVEQTAFEDIRTCYLRAMAAVMLQQKSS